MKKNKILIVDDSRFDRELLCEAISKIDEYEILEASSGQECLDILAIEKIDLILMDIMMPGQSGTETLMKIREKFNPVELPVLMVTAKSDEMDIVGCLKSGANDYLQKPINLNIALSRISTHINLAVLAKESARLKELAAIDALIATYNHEINSPLSVAIANLDTNNISPEAKIEKVRQALWKIADVVKKIRDLRSKKEARYETYVGSSKIFKID